MVDTLKIEIQKVGKSKISQVDFSNLPFGKVFTDHMFVADYREGAWGRFRIIPYGNIQVSPGTPAIHYGQSIFEGLKAHRGPGRDALVFRPRDNWKRLNVSGERMCMPRLPEEVFMEGLASLIDLEREWIPRTEGGSLYIRPFLFSAEEYIGIRVSENWTFMIITSPAGAYYSAPLRVLIETKFTRAPGGGTGFAKAAGNYGGAIYPTQLAIDKGYHQLIWTDGVEHKYIEESGTMNLMFIVDGRLVTPALSDSILAGITRDSVLQLARRRGLIVEERKLPVNEVIESFENGKIQDAFGVGTAVTISPIELIGYRGKDYRLPPVGQRPVSSALLKDLEAIKRGLAPDPDAWIVRM